MVNRRHFWSFCCRLFIFSQLFPICPQRPPPPVPLILPTGRGRHYACYKLLYCIMGTIQPLLGPVQPGRHTLWSVGSPEIGKIFATRCQILRLKCTTFHFHWVLTQTPLCLGRGYPELLSGGREKGRKREGSGGLPLFNWQWREGGEGKGHGGMSLGWNMQKALLFSTLSTGCSVVLIS